MSRTPLFGSALRRIRESRPPAKGQTHNKHCLSTYSVAVRCGVVPTTITLYEYGERTPSLQVFARIAEAMQMDHDEIVYLIHVVAKERAPHDD